MKINEVDGSLKGTIRGRVLPGCHINEACHVSFLDWMVYRIKASLRLPCISHIYSAPLFPHFQHFQQEIVVRAESSALSEHSIENLYPSVISSVNYSLHSVVSTSFSFFIIIFSMLHFVSTFLLDLHTRQQF